MMSFVLLLKIVIFVAVILHENSAVRPRSRWHPKFLNSTINLFMGTVQEEPLTITGLENISGGYSLYLRSENPDLVIVNKVINSNEVDHSKGTWTGTFNVSAEFIGQTNIFVEMIKADNESERSTDSLAVVITRKMRTIDHIFTGSVALLVSLLYINFGAALELNVLRSILMRPIGPAIGFFGQFLIMPLISYALGVCLFPDMVELQLGLFFTGVSPGGGASNIWTVILKGNMNLSIVMTTISTFAAFGMMPFWIFTLGRVIFSRGNLGVPYENIAFFAIALIIPLCIGVLIQKFLPRVTKFLVRILKPIAVILILFIIVFAIVTNLYMFQLFSWRIILAGLGLPFFGYTLSWCIAKLLKQNRADSLAISIETGIQNTGISIFLLRFALNQPQADLTQVVPVAVALMTPLPLFIVYICQRIWKPRDPLGGTTESIMRNDSDN